MPTVVYFDQRLGAGHSNRWSKYAFLTFLCQKAKKGEKSKEFSATFIKKLVFEVCTKTLVEGYFLGIQQNQRFGANLIFFTQ